MSKHRSVRAELTGVAITLVGITLAGCSGVPTGTAPDVPGESTGSTSTGTTSPASSAAPVGSARPSASSVTSARPSASSVTSARPSASSVTSARPSASSVTSARPGGRQSATSRSFVQADSIPFPVTVGNTWVYQTTAAGQIGQTTNRIVAAEPVAAGYQVTMSSTTDVAGTVSVVQSVYVFYPDGTIGCPVPPIDGVSVLGGGVRWPDAAGLASGQAYHSVLRMQVSQTGQYENADVTVQGAGTTSVQVPAGTYHASVVDTIISAKAGTIAVTTWIAQGIGPVRTEVVIRAAGTTELTTNELLSFTKGAIAGFGS